jgi:hypothetical protein
MLSVTRIDPNKFRYKYDFLADKGVCFKEIHFKESIGNEEPRGAEQSP